MNAERKAELWDLLTRVIKEGDFVTYLQIINNILENKYDDKESVN